MKYIIFLAITCIYASAFAQTGQENGFKEGFRFTVNRVENTNAYIRYNESVLDLNYRVTVDRNYQVTSSNNGQFVISSTTEHLIDTVQTEGNTTVYTSSTRADVSSEIQAAIDSLMRTPAQIALDAAWVVSSEHEIPESLAGLFGVYSGIQQKGETFFVFPDFTFDSTKDVGYKWHEETAYETVGNRISDYEIETKDAGYFTIQYSRNVFSDNMNANENAILVIERATGFVIESNVKTISRKAIDFRGRQCMLEKWTDVIQSISSISE